MIKSSGVRVALTEAGYTVSKSSTPLNIRAYRPHIDPYVIMWYTLTLVGYGSAWRVSGHMTGPAGIVDFFPRPGQFDTVSDIEDLVVILAAGPISIPYRRAI